MKNKSKVIILSASGFPLKKSAANHKHKLIAKALRLASYDVILLSKLNTFANLESDYGEEDNIKYYFLSGVKQRDTLIKKIFGIIRAFGKELKIIMKYKPSGNQHSYLILSYCAFPFVLYYWLLSKLLSYKLVISIMEYHPSIAEGFLGGINAKLFDNYSFYFADGALPISHFLNDHIKKRYPKFPTLILPVLADFNEFKNNELRDNKFDEKYFLFCGSLGYFDTIQFLIKLFLSLDIKDIKLKLVIAGKVDKINKFIESIRIYPNIEVYNDLSFSDLYEMYANACGLLVPLRPVLQDKARFPQKIAEYLASSAPIITNDYGEIPFYFEDNRNAFIVKDYDIEAYKKKLVIVLENPLIASKVGLNGFKLGQEKFHYENYAPILDHFLGSLRN